MTVFLALVAILPAPAPVRDECETIERNATYDECGKLVFLQWIFWGTEHVQAWRLDKGQTIERDYRRGGYVLRWHDGDTFREVRAKCYRETWTQYDPEQHDRDEWPKEWRRELSKRD